MNKTQEKPHKALGKGLSAFLPGRTGPVPQAAPENVAHNPSIPSGAALRAELDRIDPNPLQPRNAFDPAKLQELADSIRVNGVIQPLIVRRNGERFQLIAGERRLRAAKMAGLQDIPVIVQDLADNRLLEVALIENIQREDLNPIETAQAFDRLARELHLSHEEIGRRTGKDRTTITNMLRLLKLPADVQILLAEWRLSTGHARALLGLDNEEKLIELGNRAAAQGLSVRQVERTVSDLTQQRSSDPSTPKAQDPNVKAAAQELEETLGTRVRIVEKTEQRGKIEIDYYSQEDLDRIYTLIVGER